jgi:hypothetical protein
MFVCLYTSELYGDKSGNSAFRPGRRLRLKHTEDRRPEKNQMHARKDEPTN